MYFIKFLQENTEKLHVVVKLWTCIRELSISVLSRVTSYLLLGFRQGKSVGIVTKIPAGRSQFDSRHVKERDSLFSSQHPDRLWGSPIFLSSEY
jgi:hypothetical protein